MKKRNVNVEIASELVDLIMDVADEAFDFQEKGEKQLDKPTWRSWMEIFKQGKKVSEQNMIVEEEDIPPQADSQLNLIGTSITPQQLIREVKNDPVYEDLLTYITMSGTMNLRLTAPNQWH